MTDQTSERIEQQRPARYHGEVAYIYSYDLAYDMKREPIGSLLGQKLEEYGIGPSRRSPRNVMFYRPLMIVLPPQRRIGPRGPGGHAGDDQGVQRGGDVRSRHACRSRSSISPNWWITTTWSSRPTGSLEAEISSLAERVRNELLPYCVRPVAKLGQAEAYTAFCVYHLPPDVAEGQAEAWLDQHRRQIAGLLTDEPDAARLSEQETAESTGQALSYYTSDLAVVDWDAALLVDQGQGLEELLHILELANVQLVELAAYDRLLDESLERAYRDVAKRHGLIRRYLLRDLRVIRVDLARLSDELVNITKFFGDWHLARIYSQLSQRFHLSDWHRIIDEKLKTLGDLYGLLQQEQTNLLMIVLEVMIILLFIVDVVILLTGLGR